jgi:phospholipase C
MLYSGTALGTVSSSASGFELPAPANGTLMDMMTKYGVTWKNYFTDLPCLAIIPQTVENHPTNFGSIAEFFADAAAGLLPNVCFVDPEMGGIDDVGGNIDGYLNSIPNLPPSIASVMNTLENESNAQGQDEENPQDIALGEAFVARVVNAVMQSPQWERTLLIWTYDEHGGYYDHVPPLGAVKPDNIAPMISASDYQGSYNITGIRIPTVVVSPYSRPNAVSNIPHDHTSIIATIAAKWNLPALTYRDAQAHTLLDYLNLSGPPAFLIPPTLAAPSLPTVAGGSKCEATPPPPIISPDARTSKH